MFYPKSLPWHPTARIKKRPAPDFRFAAMRIIVGIFVVAALGGFILFSFHLRRRALPVPIIGIHGFVAVIAFVVLLVAIFGRT